LNFYNYQSIKSVFGFPVFRHSTLYFYRGGTILDSTSFFLSEIIKKMRDAIMNRKIVLSICEVFFCFVLFAGAVNSAEISELKSQGVRFSSDNKTLDRCPKNITFIVIPYGVTTIGAEAFEGCSNLISVTIPSSVTTIGDAAFAYCLNMESITIPEGVKRIEDGAFTGCYYLKSISLPQSLEYLGGYVFWNCTSLPSIVIPKNVKEIGYRYGNLFRGCNQLKSLTVEEGNSQYDSRSACNAIVETASNSLITACAGTRIVEGIETIVEEAFTGMPIHSLHLPKTVSKIENYAFFNCEELVSITVDEGNPLYSSPAGSNALLTKDGKTLVLGCGSTVFPKGITHIGEGAFGGNRVPMGSLSLPEGIKVIGERAFSHCPNLWIITIPSSVDYIGEYAFSYCSKLNVASLKGGGKKLAFGAFFECEKLVAIELPQGMESIGNIAFSHCTNLYSVSLPSSLQEVGFESFKDCPCEKEVLQLVQKNKK
jgi:hypothetical protein